MRKRFITFVITLLSIFLITSCCQNSEFIRPELSEPTPAASFYADNLSVDSSDKLSVHFIDVGQADCALLLCGGESMLIDGGNAADSACKGFDQSHCISPFCQFHSHHMTISVYHMTKNFVNRKRILGNFHSLSKSSAPCLQSGHTKSAGSSSPSYT